MGDLDALGGVARNLSYIIAVFSAVSAAVVTWLYTRLKDKFVTRPEYEAEVKELRERLERHENRLNEGQRRFNELQRDMKTLSTREDIHRVELTLKEQEGDQKAMLEAINGMRGTLEFLVEQHGKGDK